MKVRVNPDKSIAIYGSSSETKPIDVIENFNLSEGDTFYEWDTTDVYMWNGTGWQIQE